MNKRPKILVVGSLAMDLIVSTKRFPTAGETVLGCDFGTAPGGKGANQAVQAALLGAQVDMVGRVGDDANGKELLRSAERAELDVSRVQIDGSLPTAVGNILLEVGEDGKNQNRIIVVPGANMGITPESVAFLKDCIRDYDMVLLQHEIPMEVNEAVVDIAAGQGVPVLLNPAPAKEIPERMLRKLTYLVPNESEAALLTGIGIRKDDGRICFQSANNAAKALLSRGVKTVIITLGNEGALCVTEDSAEHCPIIDKVTPIDPTAAGDSFIGAFAVMKASGKPNMEAMRFASGAAAVTVSRKGAQPSLPTLDEVVGLVEIDSKSEN